MNIMIEEFKYIDEEIKGVTSLTLKKEDIIKLSIDMQSILEKYDVLSKYTLISNVNRKSYSNVDSIDFLKFGSSVEAMIIEYHVDEIIDIGIYLSTYEKEIILPGYKSMYNIQSNDEKLLLQVSDYLRKFTNKKKNYHYIVHKHATLISVPLGMIVLYFLNKYFEVPNYANVVIIAFIPFYVFTRTFRWLMPYTYFVEENELKGKLRYFAITTILGIVAAGIWELIKLLISK